MARIVFTLEDGTRIERNLDSNVMTIGRHPESTVVLSSPSVSSHHATIKLRGEDYFVQDLGTTNGTRLNGVDVEEAKLSDRDAVTFGDVPAVIYLTAAPAAKPAAKPAAPPPVPADPAPAAALPPPVIVRPGAPPPLGMTQGGAYRPRRYKSEGGGCASFLLLMFFLVLAFVVGLSMRYYNESKGGLLPVRVFDKYRDKFGLGKSDSAETPPVEKKKVDEKAKGK